MKGLLCTQTVVKNILDGQTQDRRPMKAQPVIYTEDDTGDQRWKWSKGKEYCTWAIDLRPNMCALGCLLKHAPSQVGDILGIIEDTMFVRACRKLFPGLWGLIWRYYVVGWVEVTEVRYERVQDISHSDIFCEGIKYKEGTEFWENGYREAFKDLWNTLYPGSWDRNDWVLVRTFKQIDKERK